MLRPGSLAGTNDARGVGRRTRPVSATSPATWPAALCEGASREAGTKPRFTSTSCLSGVSSGV